MTSQYWRCSTAEQIDKLARYLKMSVGPNGFRVTWEEWRDKRSLNANNLYWQWLTVMAEHFSRGGKKFTKDDMHDLMRHQFLGYEDKVIGSTVIAQQLGSTSSLDTSQMHRYMVQIDAWAADHGCLLPRPEDCDYETYRQAAA